MQIHDHWAMVSLYGYAFMHLNQRESSKANALLQESRPLSFIEFASTTGMEPKKALFYLVVLGFGWLLTKGKQHQPLFFEGLRANGMPDVSLN